MKEAAIGIDIGTSGVRLAARGQDGALLAMASEAFAAPYAREPEHWYTCVAKAFAQLDLANIQVVALAIDGTSGTIVPLNTRHEILGPVSMYNDVAVPRHVERLARLAPAESAAHGATSPLARALAWPEDALLVHQADWLMGRFTGRYDVSDENNALKSGYDPLLRVWPGWIDEAGFARRRLPQVLPAGTAVAPIKPEIASALGLPADVMVVAGTTDGCASFLASGASETGDAATALGTTLTLKLLSATPVFAVQYGIYSHRIGEQWLAGGASNAGGAALLQFFSPEQIELLSEQMNHAVATGLDYYPLPKTGERFPINDPDLAPRVTPRPPEDALFLQGLFEGIASIEALGYLRLAELGASQLRSVRSLGGGAANRAWTAIRERILGVPLLAPMSEHAAVGTARLAWRGIGHAD